MFFTKQISPSSFYVLLSGPNLIVSTLFQKIAIYILHSEFIMLEMSGRGRWGKNRIVQIHMLLLRISYLIVVLAYFPGVARVFNYPNLIVICVPTLAEIAHLDGIFTIITSMLLDGILPTRRLIYILLHLRTNYSVEYPTVNSFTFLVTR
jgi:hypothetical protein